MNLTTDSQIPCKWIIFELLVYIDLYKDKNKTKLIILSKLIIIRSLMVDKLSH